MNGLGYKNGPKLGETGSSLLRAWMVVKQLLMASYVRSTALLYVLQGDLRNFLAVRAAYRDAGSPGEFLNPHGKLLSASRASDLHASGFGFFIHTRTKIYKCFQYNPIIIDLY